MFIACMNEPTVQSCMQLSCYAMGPMPVTLEEVEMEVEVEVLLPHIHRHRYQEPQQSVSHQHHKNGLHNKALHLLQVNLIEDGNSYY